MQPVFSPDQTVFNSGYYILNNHKISLLMSYTYYIHDYVLLVVYKSMASILSNYDIHIL